MGSRFEFARQFLQRTNIVAVGKPAGQPAASVRLRLKTIWFDHGRNKHPRG